MEIHNPLPGRGSGGGRPRSPKKSILFLRPTLLEPRLAGHLPQEDLSALCPHGSVSAVLPNWNSPASRLQSAIPFSPPSSPGPVHAPPGSRPILPPSLLLFLTSIRLVLHAVSPLFFLSRSSCPLGPHLPSSCPFYPLHPPPAFRAPIHPPSASDRPFLVPKPVRGALATAPWTAARAPYPGAAGPRRPAALRRRESTGGQARDVASSRAKTDEGSSPSSGPARAAPEVTSRRQMGASSAAGEPEARGGAAAGHAHQRAGRGQVWRPAGRSYFWSVPGGSGCCRGSQLCAWPFGRPLGKRLERTGGLLPPARSLLACSRYSSAWGRRRSNSREC